MLALLLVMLIACFFAKVLYTEILFNGFEGICVDSRGAPHAYHHGMQSVACFVFKVESKKVSLEVDHIKRTSEI